MLQLEPLPIDYPSRDGLFLSAEQFGEISEAHISVDLAFRKIAYLKGLWGGGGQTKKNTDAFGIDLETEVMGDNEDGQ